MDNDCLHQCFKKGCIDLAQCNCLVYASSLTSTQKAHGKRNAWRARLEEKIQKLRRYLSQLIAIHSTKSISPRLCHLKRQLFKKYTIVDKSSFLIAVENLKQHITCCAARLCMYKTRVYRYWQNNTFNHNQQAFYRCVCPSTLGVQKSRKYCHFGKPSLKRNLMLIWSVLGCLI